MGLVNDFNNTLSLWLNSHGFSNIDIVEGEEFCYYYTSHTIQWGFFSKDSTDNNFRQFIAEYGSNYNDIEPFILSLIHELGHHMTLPNFSADELEEEKVRKEIRALENSSIDINYWYWELPTELAANVWTINFINNNIELVEELQDLCKSHIEKILSDNNILQQLFDWQYDMMNGEDYRELIIEED